MNGSSECEAVLALPVVAQFRRSAARFCMGLFDDAIEFLARVENPKQQRMNSRKRLATADARKFRTKFPLLPGEFVVYLRKGGQSCLPARRD